jgi:hypothetical protein
MGKIATPAWITEGYDSPEEYNKAHGIVSEKKPKKVKSKKKPDKSKSSRKIKVRECPKCGSDNVGLVLINSDAEEGGGKEWECEDCKWKGEDIRSKEMSEDEFIEYMEKKETNEKEEILEGEK